MREMKDSGIEWIGEIPKDWKVKRCKNISNFINGYAFDSKAFQNDFLYSVIRIGDIKEGYIDNINCLGVSNNKGLDRYLIKENDILLAMSGATVGKVGIAHGIKDAYINQRVGIIRTTSPRFLFYCLSTREFIEYILLRADGSAQPNVSGDVSGEFYIPYPRLKEQNNISDFLDTKCSEIDATAEDIQKEFSLLEDYKKSVITEAVTKGLNPDAEMKDSGVKWLPKIPKHWKVIPSKYLFANSDIRRQTGDEQLTASQKYGIITQKDYTAKENAQIVLATQGLEKWKHVEPNDFIISLRSFQGGLEMSEITGCITWHYVVLKAQKEVYHKYYKWLFKSARYINALQGTCNFIRDGQDLRFSNFALVPLFELPLEEQQQIADYLDSKCSEIDTLIADKKRQLDILADYKKSLIYEYVTGKKEVPVNE